MAEVQPIPASSSQPRDLQAQDSLCGTVVGRFRIGERLGQGGMGEVYRAEDTKLKRTVALKRLAPSLRADSLYRHRFLEEAERASCFGDAHVAAVYDVLEEHGEIFLILEYVEGQNLRQRLRQPLSLEEFFAIATQCAEALVSAHRQGIVHCDIKPENIMLTRHRQCKNSGFRRGQTSAAFRPEFDRGSFRHLCRHARLHVSRGFAGAGAGRPRRHFFVWAWSSTKF